MEKMTSRERVLAALSRQETDIVPFSLGFGVNPPARDALARHLGFSAPQTDALLLSCSDIRCVSPRYRGPADRCVTHPSGVQVDIWGVERRPVRYGEGEYMEISRYPLADVEDISQLDETPWPSPDWLDADDIRSDITRLNAGEPYAIQFGIASIFETAWYMRGFERMFMDLVLNPELAWELLTRVTDYYIALFDKVLSAAGGGIDIAFTADDIGGQQGLLMAPALWRRMIRPHHARLNRRLHEHGVFVMYHSDGAVMDAVPELITMGIDVLEALQFDAAGMDPAALKDQYADRLGFHGGVSVQRTLPFATAEAVAAEVRERIAVLGRGGGYILAPSHAIQAGTPPENIVAFLNAAGRF